MSPETNWRKLIVGLLGLLLLLPLLTSATAPAFWLYTKSWLAFGIIEILIALWLIASYFYRDFRPKNNILVWAVTAFIAVNLIILAFSISPIKSWWGTHLRQYEAGVWALLHYAALFFVSSSLTADSWKKLWRWSVFISLLVSIYSIFQYFDFSWTLPIIDNRVTASFGNPIYLAVYLLWHVFVAAWLWLSEGNKWRRTLYLLAAAFNLFIIYLTKSQGVWLGVGVSIVWGYLYWLFRNKNFKKWLLPMAITVTLLASLVVAFIPGLLADTKDISARNRFLTWSAAGQAFQDKPVLGWGQENFNIAFESQYNPKIFFRTGDLTWFDRAHNVFIEWLVVGGILGLLAYLFLWFGASKILPRMDNKEASVWGAMLVAFLTQSLFLFDFQFSYFFFFLALAFLSSSRGYISNTSESRRLLVLILLIIIPVSALALNIWFGARLANAAKWQEQATVTANTTEQTEFLKKALDLNTPANLLIIRDDLLISNINTADKSKKFNLVDYYLDITSELIEQYPNESPLWYRQGQLYDIRFTLNQDQNDLSLARSSLEQALVLSPGRQQIIFELASNRILAGDNTTAITLLEQSVATNSDLLITHLFLGLAYLSDNQTEKGSQEITTTFNSGYQFDDFEFDDLDESRLNFMIEYYLRIRDYQMLKLLYKQAITWRDASEDHLGLAMVYKALGDHEAAAEEALEALERDYYLEDEVRLFLEGLK